MNTPERVELLAQLENYLKEIKQTDYDINFSQISDYTLQEVVSVVKKAAESLYDMQPARANTSTSRTSRVNLVKKLGMLYGFIQSMDQVDSLTDGGLEILALRCLNKQKQRRLELYTLKN